MILFVKRSVVFHLQMFFFQQLCMYKVKNIVWVTVVSPCWEMIANSACYLFFLGLLNVFVCPQTLVSPMLRACFVPDIVLVPGFTYLIWSNVRYSSKCSHNSTQPTK